MLISKKIQKQPFRDILRKRSCIYAAILQDGCSSVNLLHIFRTPFPKEHPWRAVSGNISDGHVIKRVIKTSYQKIYS